MIYFANHLPAGTVQYNALTLTQRLDSAFEIDEDHKLQLKETSTISTLKSLVWKEESTSKLVINVIETTLREIIRLNKQGHLDESGECDPPKKFYVWYESGLKLYPAPHLADRIIQSDRFKNQTTIQTLANELLQQASLYPKIPKDECFCCKDNTILHTGDLDNDDLAFFTVL